MIASAAAMQAHDTRGTRAIVVLISQIPELSEQDTRPILMKLRARRDAGERVALDVLRDPDRDGSAMNVVILKPLGGVVGDVHEEAHKSVWTSYPLSSKSRPA